MTKPSSSIQSQIIRIETLVDTLKKSDLTEYPNIHDLNNTLDQILLALWVVDEKFPSLKYVPPDAISEILVDVFRVSKNVKSVKNALAQAKGKVHPKESSGEILYRIMEKGINHLKDISGEGKLQVYRIGGNTPRKDKQFLADVIESSKSEIKIIDPYFGSRTLDNLENLDFGKPIKLITTKIQLENNQSMSAFSTDLRDFKINHRKFEGRKFPNNPKELHDRYILTKNSLIIVGHGIKDLGGKESFILTFEGKNIDTDILTDLHKKFDERWLNSTPL